MKGRLSMAVPNFRAHEKHTNKNSGKWEIMSNKTTQYSVRRSPEGYELIGSDGMIAAICADEPTAKELANANLPLAILKEISAEFYRLGMKKDATVLDFLIETIENYSTEKSGPSFTLKQWLSRFASSKK